MWRPTMTTNLTETLPYFIALQPQIRKMMGKLQPGDRVYDTDEHGEGFIVCFPDKKYPMRVDFYWYKTDYISNYVPGDELIRLPLPINRGRDLISMLLNF
jgi:hypothetical protein